MSIFNWLLSLFAAPKGVIPVTIPPTPRVRLDKDAPNLFIGKIIDDGSIKCEVISCEKGDFRIKILEINWKWLGTYMDLGKVYPLLICFDRKGMQTWKVDPDQMKRSTSQVILQWEEGIGWVWDLDS